MGNGRVSNVPEFLAHFLILKIMWLDDKREVTLEKCEGRFVGPLLL